MHLPLSECDAFVGSSWFLVLFVFQTVMALLFYEAALALVTKPGEICGLGPIYEQKIKVLEGT